MCTVSFLPASNGNYILTSNRDEHVIRQRAMDIQQYRIGNNRVYFPKDPDAGGTWIATTGNNRTVCLLNGDLVNESKPTRTNFRMSRGMMVLNYFKYQNLRAFLAQEKFDDIAPFTLIVLENTDSELQLTQLTWSGTELLVKELDSNQPIIWSSSTLFTAQQRNKRIQWFLDWLQTNASDDQSAILDFHRFTGEEDPNENLIMRNESHRTVSICSIKRSEGITRAVYHDLLTEKETTYMVYP